MNNYLEISYENNMNNLAHAVECSEQPLLHEEIIEVLACDIDDIKKQWCILELNCINSQKEADILCANLTGKSGPVRETTSYKILELISLNDYRQYFQSIDIINIFVKGIEDINPSVSRNVIEIIKYIQNADYIYRKIIENIENILKTINNESKNRSYVQNKKNFALYWNLEAITSLKGKIIPSGEFEKILEITANSNDYTIREKTAKAALMYIDVNDNLRKITNLLKDDVNIFVKNFT